MTECPNCGERTDHEPGGLLCLMNQVSQCQDILTSLRTRHDALVAAVHTQCRSIDLALEVSAVGENPHSWREIRQKLWDALLGEAPVISQPTAERLLRTLVKLYEAYRAMGHGGSPTVEGAIAAAEEELKP